MRDCIKISNSDSITLLLEAAPVQEETTPLLSPSTKKLLFVGAQLVLLDRDLETFLVDIAIWFILRLLERGNYVMHRCTAKVCILRQCLTLPVLYYCTTPSDSHLLLVSGFTKNAMSEIIV
jgi:hypothetical protein